MAKGRDAPRYADARLNPDAAGSAGNAIFSKIIAYRSTPREEVGQVCETELWGETGSRFIHISRRGLEPGKKRSLSLYARFLRHRLIL